MEQGRKLIAGGIVLLVVALVLIGWINGIGQNSKAGLKEMRGTQAEMEEKLTALTDQTNEVKENLAGITATQADLSTRMDDLQSAVDAGARNAKSLAADVNSRFEALSGKIAEAAKSAAALTAATPISNATTTKTETQAGEEATAPAAAAVHKAQAGQTLTLSDALRVFVGRLDTEGEKAIVAINGINRSTLRKGQPHSVMAADTFCHVTLSQLSNEGAGFNHLCGADVPAPKGIRVGQTVQLADKVRVFLGRLDATEGTAYVALNGLAVAPLSYDHTISVKTGAGTCNVSLLNIDRGHADLSMECPK